MAEMDDNNMLEGIAQVGLVCTGLVDDDDDGKSR